MGYQVGLVCYTERKDAENVYFSQVSPSILPDGKLVKPEYIGNQWQLNGQILTANLPECDPAKSMKDGAELGWLVVGIMASLFVFRLIREQLK